MSPRTGANRVITCIFAFGALAFSLAATPQPGEAAPKSASRPLRGITNLYDRGSEGNQYFGQQVRSEARRAGFRFVRSLKVADATFSSKGNYNRDRSFVGSVTIRNLNGRMLWQKSVRRVPNSRVMAYESITRELRAAK